MASLNDADLPPLPLPAGLRERQINSSASDLSYHIIEAGEKGRPLILLLHGFPELAYSFRKIMPALAQHGFYAVAFDQRGFGRTTGWDNLGFDQVDLRTFSQTNLVRDVMVLALRLGYHQVECVVGHDFGCVPAAWSAVARPDIFRHVVLMSHPFTGSSELPFDADFNEEKDQAKPDLHKELSKLSPPRKHYRWYYSTAQASQEMSPRKDLDVFLRGYFHLKSADSPTNPQPIEAMTAEQLSKLPPYYIMPLESGMRATVSHAMTPSESSHMQALCARWFPDAELAVYVDEFRRTGFQGGLNWYRVSTAPEHLARDVDIFAGKKLDVPCLFVAGEKDWNVCQTPRALERMRHACTDLRVRFVEKAGHWVQQERPEEVVREILKFIEESPFKSKTEAEP